MENTGKLLTSLPFGSLIGGPLRAAIEAQAIAAKATIDFIHAFGFKAQTQDVGSNTAEDFNSGELRNIVFSYRTTTEDGEETRVFTVPLLSMIPIPVMSIETMDIDFSVRIEEAFETETQHSSKSQDRRSSHDASSSYWQGGGRNVSFNAQYAHQVSNNSSGTKQMQTSTSLNIKVRATSEAIPLGLTKLLTMVEGFSREVPSGAIESQPTPIAD